MLSNGSPTQNRNYCRKEGGKNFWESTKWTGGTGRRNDLQEVCDAIKQGKRLYQIQEDRGDMVVARHLNHFNNFLFLHNQANKSQFRQPRVWVLTGPPGQGKTSFVYSLHEPTEIYKMSQGIAGSLWFDGYGGEEVLLFDDFNGWIPYDTLLNYIDGYSVKAQIKFGHVFKNWKYVYFTSNLLPVAWYANINIEAFTRRVDKVFDVETSPDGRLNLTTIHANPVPWTIKTHWDQPYKEYDYHIDGNPVILTDDQPLPRIPTPPLSASSPILIPTRRRIEPNPLSSPPRQPKIALSSPHRSRPASTPPANQSGYQGVVQPNSVEADLSEEPRIHGPVDLSETSVNTPSPESDSNKPLRRRSRKPRNVRRLH